MRWIYFAGHFVAGFLLLWLTYTFVKQTFLVGPSSPPLATEAFVETAYLLAGVVWGNVGWDTFTRRLPKGASFSMVAYALSRTVATPLIVLPVVLWIVDFVKQGPAVWRASGLTWSSAGLFLASLLLLAVYLRYRKSEMAVFYSAHGA